MKYGLVIVAGYAWLVIESGWIGVAAAGLHIGVMLLAMARR